MPGLSETVDGLVRARFTGSARARAVGELLRVDTSPFSVDHDRVLLAVLTLAGGDLDRLAWAVDAANADWRDVIGWAERLDEDAPAPG